jgi:hypothetical protein
MIEALVEERLVEKPLGKSTSSPELNRVPVPVCPSIDRQEQEPIRSGSGACRACDCRGFRKSKADDGYCGNCGHGWSRHR